MPSYFPRQVVPALQPQQTPYQQERLPYQQHRIPHQQNLNHIDSATQIINHGNLQIVNMYPYNRRGFSLRIRQPRIPDDTYDRLEQQDFLFAGVRSQPMFSRRDLYERYKLLLAQQQRMRNRMDWFSGPAAPSGPRFAFGVGPVRGVNDYGHSRAEDRARIADLERELADLRLRMEEMETARQDMGGAGRYANDGNEFVNGGNEYPPGNDFQQEAPLPDQGFREQQSQQPGYGQRPAFEQQQGRDIIPRPSTGVGFRGSRVGPSPSPRFEQQRDYPQDGFRRRW